MAPKGATPDKVWKLLIKNIRERMGLVEQWRQIPNKTGWAETSLKYLHELEGLVELLEEADCGSCGGYGEGQFETNETHDKDVGDLFDRAKWLLNKYKKGGKK